MSTSVLICDDSSMARKLLARALPGDWAVRVAFAANGRDALESLRREPAQVLFLDLNMPVMDGYEVLEQLATEPADPTVFVVSGDIQPEAHDRVIRLGAAGFLRKPVDRAELRGALVRKGLISGTANGVETSLPRDAEPIDVDFRDCCQEVANVAMGRAADLLARLLDVFILLPVPNVNTLEVSELRMALAASEEREGVTAVSQGFIGGRIAGEALVLFHDSSFSDIAALMNYQGDTDESVELELVMDAANVLIGACLTGIADQLDISFSQSHPTVLGRHTAVSEIVAGNAPRWRKTLAIEIDYTVKQHNVTCDLLLLFAEESIDTLRDKMTYLL